MDVCTSFCTLQILIVCAFAWMQIKITNCQMGRYVSALLLSMCFTWRIEQATDCQSAEDHIDGMHNVLWWCQRERQWNGLDKAQSCRGSMRRWNRVQAHGHGLIVCLHGAALSLCAVLAVLAAASERYVQTSLSETLIGVNALILQTKCHYPLFSYYHQAHTTVYQALTWMTWTWRMWLKSSMSFSACSSLCRDH